MFGKRDKVKELAIYFVQTPNVSCLVTDNKNYKPAGVSTVKSYQYKVNDLKVYYDKWFVEAFEEANQMGLPGCEHHGQLVKGSGVVVLTPQFGRSVFYGKDAQDIIDACESGCNMSLYKNINQIQK